MTSRVKELLAPLTESKLPLVYAKGSLRFKQITLDTARNGFEVNLEGGGGADFVYFDETSTANTGATMTIDDESSTAKLPVGPTRGFRDVPCKRVFITCAAYTGGVLNMWYGKGAFIYGQTPGAKGQWYDRNPLTVYAAFSSGNTGPHAGTTRWTYTVPANRKFALQTGMTFQCRVTASGATGSSTGQIALWQSGNFRANLVYTRMVNLTVDAKDRSQIAGASVLLAGDTLECDTADASSTGAIAWECNMEGLEFDA